MNKAFRLKIGDMDLRITMDDFGRLKQTEAYIVKYTEHMEAHMVDTSGNGCSFMWSSRKVRRYVTEISISN